MSIPELYTREELIEKIKSIDAILEGPKRSRLDTLQDESEYEYDPTTLRKQRKDYWDMLCNMNNPGGNNISLLPSAKVFSC